MARPRSHEATKGGGASSYFVIDYNKQDLRELKDAIRNSGKEARASLRKRLKEVGRKVQTEIQSITPVHGGRYGSRSRATSRIVSGKTQVRTARHAPGLLRKSNKLKISTLSVTVYNDARSVSARYPGGYRYGKRLEFDPKFSGRYAFFYKGWESTRPAAIAEMKKVLDDVAAAFSKGG